MDVTLNAKECFRSIDNFGGTLYQNICGGGTKFVPWGAMDWLGFLVVVIIVGLVIWGIIYAYNDMKHF